MSVTDFAGLVLMLQVFNETGPAKSCRAELISGDDRVWGRNVLTHPVKPRVSRLTPPSMNSLVETVLTSSPLAWPRQTHPPQRMAPVLAPLTVRLNAAAATAGARM